MKKVAIQGQKYSFHDQAVKAFFGNEATVIACESFAEVFESVQNGEAETGLVAIENSLYGSINQVYDLLLKKNFWISGEVFLKISHCLIGLEGAKLSSVTEVHSHPVALAQCEAFLDTHLPGAERFEHHDTAGSARDIKKWNDPHKAAIASREAAEAYDLQILQERIETHHQNYTRFVIIEKQSLTNPRATKTSLVITTKEDTKAGALYEALGAFAQRNINLSLLHSRPLIGKAWHYMFYIDVDAGLEDSKLQAALKELETLRCNVTILGTYKAAAL